MRFLFAILALPIAASVSACGNTYHPEYHPVTTTTYSQSVGGGGYPAPGPTLQAAPPPRPPQPPPDFPW
jgi:hypothetical protein